MATVAVSEHGGLKGYLATHRTLETYPVGAHRWAMLMLTVLATIVSFYEFQFAPLLPLWIPTLHFSLENFTLFLLFAVLLSGGSAMIGGPLADRHGRIIVIDVCLAIIIVLTFANLLMTGFWSFVIIRGAMNLTAGLMWGALGGLTRDMSPRVSRGTAFGLLTVGAVGCVWLWNFISGETLPIFGTWQSQIWIMGILSILMYIPVLLWLKDLHPTLRLTIVESEATVAASPAEHMREAVTEIPASGAAAFKELLRRWEVWVLVTGSVAFLTLPITSQTFFPVMFTRAFHYSAAEAAKMASYFWLLNLFMLVPAGWLSDRLRVRKPLVLIGTVATLAVLIWWIGTFSNPLPPFQLGAVMFILGGLVAFAFIPWCAQYSELLEDISPALQASGWSFFQLIYRGWIAISGPLVAFVSSRYGWAAWMWVAVAGMAMFIPAMLAVRGGWVPAKAGQGSGEPAATAARPSPA
ncbi:MAG TPA: MFS transporter [Candidatus Binataceae bacterium]|jgi:OPA family glycerol-3-phosphate transporter-like MFS transporter|nr:MFS transporter [Candidatus Binataceae bacterium]